MWARTGFLATGVVVLTLSVGARTSTQGAFGALPLETRAPAANPMTAEKVALGRLLFWDPILSGSRDVACATCHHPDFGYAERLDLSIGVTGVGLGSHRRFPTGSAGVPFVKRNSQTLLNVAFAGMDDVGNTNPATAQMFWDVRVQSLEAQALEPIKAFEEMRGHAYGEDRALDEVVARIAAIPEYVSLFERAFGSATAVSAANVGRAIASFERTLVAGRSPFDRYQRGETTAMTPVQIRGMAQFQEAGCVNCHRGPMFSDYKIHTLGVPDNPKLAASDTGVAGTYGFRTPTLRNLRFTAPYMHSGVFPTLDAVLSFYDGIQGGRPGRPRNPLVPADRLAPLLSELSVRGRQRDIVEFLDALNDEQFDRAVPDRVPSGLPVGGAIR